MASQIYSNLWFATQTVESIHTAINENPIEVIHILIDQIFDENAPHFTRTLAMQTLKALDLSTFNFPLRINIENAVSQIFDFENRSSNSDSDSEDSDGLETQDGMLLSSDYDDISPAHSEESDDPDQKLEETYQELQSKYLIDAEPKEQKDPEAVNRMLIEFCRQNSLEGVDLALASGASIEAVDKENGFTPLCWAAHHQDDELFEYLICSHAKIDVSKEQIYLMIEKWVKEQKYDQLRQLLRRGFELGTQFYNQVYFLDLLLNNAGNVAKLLEPMSEDWKLFHSETFLDVRPEYYTLVIPGDFAIAFSVESFLDHILGQSNFDFLKGNLLVCMAQFLSNDKKMTRSVNLLKKLKIDQQREFYEALDGDLERMIIKELYLHEVDHLKGPKERATNRFAEMKEFVKKSRLIQQKIDTLVQGFSENESDMEIKKPQILATINKIDRVIATISEYQTKKIPLWEKQSQYIRFWIDEAPFNEERQKFKGHITDIYTIQTKLNEVRRRLQRMTKSVETAIFATEEKGEIIANPLQYNTKIHVLHKSLKKLGCVEDFIYENHDQLYGVFYSTFDDHVREMNTLRKSSDENKAQEVTLKLYKNELKMHLENVFALKKIQSPADIVL